MTPMTEPAPSLGLSAERLQEIAAKPQSHVSRAEFLRLITAAEEGLKAKEEDHLRRTAREWFDRAQAAEKALEEAREALKQAALELGAAVPLLRTSWPNTATVFAKAAERALLSSQRAGS